MQRSYLKARYGPLWTRLVRAMVFCGVLLLPACLSPGDTATPVVAPPQPSIVDSTFTAPVAPTQGQPSGLTPLPPERWGGGLDFLVTEQGAKVDFGCNFAYIMEPIFVDATGRYDVVGEWHRGESGGSRSGPFQDTRPPQVRPARFLGQISGLVMTFTMSVPYYNAAETMHATLGERVTLNICR